jgi:phosphatidylglycerophosphate synthase
VLDAPLRNRLEPSLDRAAGALAARGVSAAAVTAAGLAVGVAACVAAALAVWPLALVLWMGNRAADGLDGPLARRSAPSDLGGFLDLVADFVVYGGFVVGVAVALPDARLASCALLAAYLLNNVALLTFASLMEKRRVAYGDERSVRFTPGLTEATETFLAYALVCLLPGAAEVILWTFTAMVLVTVGQRVVMARRTLG